MIHTLTYASVRSVSCVISLITHSTTTGIGAFNVLTNAIGSTDVGCHLAFILVCLKCGGRGRKEKRKSVITYICNISLNNKIIRSFLRERGGGLPSPGHMTTSTPSTGKCFFLSPMYVHNFYYTE